MNDYEYVFKSDAAEKKRNGRGAFNKKGGSKSKKCTLPDDYLTPAQKKKLSKTIVDVNLREPMTFKEFRALSPDLQKEYLIFIRDRFGVSAKQVSTDLFCRHSSHLSTVINKEMPYLKGVFPKTRRVLTADQKCRWNLWLGKDDYIESPELKEAHEKAKVYAEKQRLEKVAREGEIDVVDITIKDELPPEAVFGPVPNVDLDPSSLSMVFDKICSYEDLCDKLRSILMAQANGRKVTHFEFTVSFTRIPF